MMMIQLYPKTYSTRSWWFKNNNKNNKDNQKPLKGILKRSNRSITFRRGFGGRSGRGSGARGRDGRGYGCCSCTTISQWTYYHILLLPPKYVYQSLTFYFQDWHTLVPFVLFGISCCCLLVYSKIVAFGMFLLSLLCDWLFEVFNFYDTNINDDIMNNTTPDTDTMTTTNNNINNNNITKIDDSGCGSHHYQNYPNRRRVHFPIDTKFITAGKAKRRRKQHRHRVVLTSQSTLPPPPSTRPPVVIGGGEFVVLPQQNNGMMSFPLQSGSANRYNNNITNSNSSGKPTTTTSVNQDSINNNNNNNNNKDNLCAVKALVGDLGTLSYQWKRLTVVKTTKDQSVSLEKQSDDKVLFPISLSTKTPEPKDDEDVIDGFESFHPHCRPEDVVLEGEKEEEEEEEDDDEDDEAKEEKEGQEEVKEEDEYDRELNEKMFLEEMTTCLNQLQGGSLIQLEADTIYPDNIHPLETQQQKQTQDWSSPSSYVLSSTKLQSKEVHNHDQLYWEDEKHDDDEYIQFLNSWGQYRDDDKSSQMDNSSSVKDLTGNIFIPNNNVPPPHPTSLSRQKEDLLVTDVINSSIDEQRTMAAIESSTTTTTIVG